MFDRVKRAWAVWMLASSSFGSKLNGCYGYDKTTGTTTRKVLNKRDSFTHEYTERMQNAQIECCDAVKIIKSRDSQQAFMYCDPPYVGSCQKP
ncbi:MAG: DNA adenine methylase [Treponemataceae bacterium]